MKVFLPFFLLTSCFNCNAQTADFITVKKKSKTVQTIFSGRDIEFTTTSGAYIYAHINGIKNDSLYLQQFITQRVPTTIGTYILDTLGSYHYKFHYNQIAALGKKEKRGFNLSGSGASLFGGGVVLTLASGIVYLADRKNFSAPLLITSAGLGAFGYFLLKAGGKPVYIGKKYQLEYMNMSNTKSN
jgi:hypothetical protein